MKIIIVEIKQTIIQNVSWLYIRITHMQKCNNQALLVKASLKTNNAPRALKWPGHVLRNHPVTSFEFIIKLNLWPFLRLRHKFSLLCMVWAWMPMRWQHPTVNSVQELWTKAHLSLHWKTEETEHMQFCMPGLWWCLLWGPMLPFLAFTDFLHCEHWSVLPFFKSLLMHLP